MALALTDGGRWLFVANQRSGSISVLETTNRRPVAEVSAGRRLADLAVTPDGNHLLAVDEEASQLVLLSRRGPNLEVVERVPVSHGPVSVQVAGDGARFFVASLWPRQLTILDLAPAKGETGARLRVAKTVALPFAPRKQVLVCDDSKLIVADAFAGRLAVVDVRRGEVETVRTLQAHNIRGLAVSPDGARLLVTHQNLNHLGRTTRDDIHWGNLITNNLRTLPLAGLLGSDADWLRGSQLHFLGDAGSGAADPAGVAAGPDGQVVITLAGVDDISFGREQDFSRRRLTVGRRPTAVVTSPDGQRAYVANTFADSVSVVDLKERTVQAEISLGPHPELTPSDRGELLFHDARLTHDAWFSCHSCHTDGHTTGQLNDNMGDGSFGAPKRILSLLGARDTGPYAWNGGMPDLESQIRKSIETTMRGRPLPEQDVAALAAYLRTLPPPPSGTHVAGNTDEEAVQRGGELFQKHACPSCHTPPVYTSRKTYDVGLRDRVGNTAFNPPSLRGVLHGGPYFHDNRAATLEEVFTRHRHQLEGELSKQELHDLLAFLGSL
jgi:YVTN family beta-propeller protein